jgi:fused signal recognition particle receptor
VPDYVTQIPARLAALFNQAFGNSSSVAHQAIARWSALGHQFLARLSYIDWLILILVVSQVVLLFIAVLIEFSARKRRRRLPEAGAETTPLAIPPEELRAREIPRYTAPRAPTPPPAEPAPQISKPAARPEKPGIKQPEEVFPSEPRKEPEPQVPPLPRVAPPKMPSREEALPPEPAPKIEPPPQAPAPPAAKAPARIGLGLRRTRENLLARIRAAITGSAKLDEVCEGLEEALIAADVGVQASLKLVEAVRTRAKSGSDPEIIRAALKDEIARMLSAAERPMNVPSEGPMVVMLAGVNGVGKTTTVAKLAARMKAERGSVIVAAADTFRAAAIEQLEVWCGRAGVDLIKQKQGSDPAAVAFDAVKAAVARNVPTVLIDTAGRLQTKVNLMEELKKIARVVGRELPGAPHECWLVLDATTGQNALSQAKIFGEAVQLSGVVLAKLDSTAKGGVVIAIAEQLKLPVRFVGVGEDIEDLRAFESREFVEALFAEDESKADASSGSYAA